MDILFYNLKNVCPLCLAAGSWNMGSLNIGLTFTIFCLLMGYLAIES